jgi:hypothetical protein
MNKFTRGLFTATFLFFATGAFAFGTRVTDARVAQPGSTLASPGLTLLSIEAVRRKLRAA